MRLFELDEQSNVKVNSPWIKLIPEFKDLFDARNKSPKMKWDADILGVKRLAYIYFMLDYSSPLMNWEDEKKQEEAMRYTGLAKEDIDRPAVYAALAKYEHLQYEMCRPLKSLRSAYKGLDAMDAYLKDVDFTAVDKQGKLLYTPNQFIGNLTLINKAYEELKKLEKKIEEEMTNSSSIRGKATMGDRELKYSKPNVRDGVEWNEDKILDPLTKIQTNWTDLTLLLAEAGKEVTEDVKTIEPLDNGNFITF